jgi:phospholipase/carboxylesterase
MKKIFTSILFFAIILSMQASDLTVLTYKVREPKIKSEITPVIILLHGVGSNEEDLFSFASQLPDKYLVISARAPFNLGGNSFAWYQVNFSSGKPVYNFEQQEKSREIIIEFIKQIKAKYLLDASKIYLCGFSQGAIMSYSVALTRPDLVAGIAVMSGRLLEEIKPKIASNEKVKHLNVFISHGKSDNTLPINYAREASAYLKSLNLRPSFKEYVAAHEINSEMLNDLINWLK